MSPTNSDSMNKPLAKMSLFFHILHNKKVHFKINCLIAQNIIIVFITCHQLMQTIGIAIQRGNSQCILSTVKDSRKMDEVYYL